jgi:SAM-dependent methyltransferase
MAYPESYYAARESWRDWRIEARELLHLAQVARGARVLEVGCGGGGLLRMLHDRGARAVGIDTPGRALDLARARPAGERESRGVGGGILLPPCSLAPLLVEVGEGDALPFRADTFDAIVGQHVIEHLPDVNAALREWRRVLKPNGYIALATPNARYPDPAHFADAAHARVFSPTEIREVVTRAGFVVAACFTAFPFLSRTRALRACGVIAYRAFQHAPYFATRGRTIMLAAHKSGN